MLLPHGNGAIFRQPRDRMFEKVARSFRDKVESRRVEYVYDTGHSFIRAIKIINRRDLGSKLFKILSTSLL